MVANIADKIADGGRLSVLSIFCQRHMVFSLVVEQHLETPAELALGFYVPGIGQRIPELDGDVDFFLHSQWKNLSSAHNVSTRVMAVNLIPRADNTIIATDTLCARNMRSQDELHDVGRETVRCSTGISLANQILQKHPYKFLSWRACFPSSLCLIMIPLLDNTVNEAFHRGRVLRCRRK